jgi:Zn-finger nucleic acid-binding protein
MSAYLIPTPSSSSSLFCPDCQAPLRKFRCQQAIVEKCPDCSGIWFPDRVLGIFRNALNQRDLSLILAIDFPPPDDRYILSCCPRCGDALDESKYSYNTAVTMRRCRKCRGIWLQTADLLELVQMTKTGQEIAPSVAGFLAEYKKLYGEISGYLGLRQLAQNLLNLDFKKIQLR